MLNAGVCRYAPRPARTATGDDGRRRASGATRAHGADPQRRRPGQRHALVTRERGATRATHPRLRSSRAFRTPCRSALPASPPLGAAPPVRSDRSRSRPWRGAEPAPCRYRSTYTPASRGGTRRVYKWAKLKHSRKASRLRCIRGAGGARGFRRAAGGSPVRGACAGRGGGRVARCAAGAHLSSTRLLATHTTQPWRGGLLAHIADTRGRKRD